MTIDTAKELQMNIAKEGLALLVLHPTADVQLHRECISHIGTAWDIPVGDTQEVSGQRIRFPIPSTDESRCSCSGVRITSQEKLRFLFLYDHSCSSAVCACSS